MANNDLALKPLTGGRWFAGFGNIFRKESSDWWKTRSLVVRTVLAVGIINGMLSIPYFVSRSQQIEIGDLLGETVSTLGPFLGLFVSIAAIIKMQSAVLGEKQLGTAHWLLSKPLSRSGFILGKLAANSLGIIASMMLVPAAVAYVQIHWMTGVWVPVGGYIAAIGLLILHLMFYLTMTILLGTVFDSRGPVLGIPLGLLLGYQIIMALVPKLGYVMPWTILDSTKLVILEGTLPMIWPVIFTPIWCVLFVVAASWHFSRQDL